MGQGNFKKPFEFHNFSEIFYCGMTKLSNTNLDVFIQCTILRTILRKKKMGQSLFKKHAKFLNFDETFDCDMTRPRNTILNYCGLWQYLKAIKPKKIVRQSLFKNQKFQYSIKFFTATWQNVGRNNRKLLENIFMQKLLYERKL